ncbi:fluoride efflux transporter CrcB [Steroidobacter cummioxidans]|uniref:fluoride efflux transporter CrcB n=1 Tax=Steroidobacter cummioxidans TaxID=1803913 RepID=UPI00158249E1|nr:fluoride efflux transporter CrcB [Steroidobacter cummioxidans]
MNGFLIVFMGGGLGAACRHGMNVLATHLVGARYPFGTFVINVLGSLLIGVLAEWFALRSHLSANLRLFLVTGILGGFTTFSAFSLEVGLLHERGDTAAAALYAVASVVCAVGAMFGGMYALRHFA